MRLNPLNSRAVKTQVLFVKILAASLPVWLRRKSLNVISAELVEHNLIFGAVATLDLQLTGCTKIVVHGVGVFPGNVSTIQFPIVRKFKKLRLTAYGYRKMRRLAIPVTVTSIALHWHPVSSVQLPSLRERSTDLSSCDLASLRPVIALSKPKAKIRLKSLVLDKFEYSNVEVRGQQ
jgi:hypothetical protein